MADETRRPQVTRFNSGLASESSFGFSRAVRAGNWILVSGCTATDESGTIVGINQMYTQAHTALANIAAVLERMGASLADVVRTRVYVTDIADLASIARAHREAFGQHPPASTLLEIGALARSDALIEIDADAFVAEPPGFESQSEGHARPRSATPSRAPAKARPRPRLVRTKARARTKPSSKGRRR
ncbi:MAG TPA: RidA family protein [Candidatus Binataceae bacterium]|nr:RidA family protein [Candidatus Binataceae bacterium]